MRAITTTTTSLSHLSESVSCYHITCVSTADDLWHVNTEKVEQTQFTISKTVTQDCDQQLVCCCLLCHTNVASWCEVRMMHS